MSAIKSVTTIIAGHLQELQVRCFDEAGNEVLPGDSMPRYYAWQSEGSWSVYERAAPRDACLFGGHTEESAREIVATLNAMDERPE